MDKAFYDVEMTKASIMVEVEREDYWTGYMRGLQRRFKGDTFGTQEEHEEWLAYADGDTEQLRERGLGYRNGFLGPVDFDDPANGVLFLRKWRGWSMDYLAEKMGVDRVTIQNWEQGKMPSEAEKKMLNELLFL